MLLTFEDNFSSHSLLQHDQMEETLRKFKRLSLKQDELLENYKAQTIRDQLRIATASVEAQGEATAQELFDGKMSVDHFLKKFISERTVRKAVRKSFLEIRFH